jgi:hypothetical protein
MTFTATLVLVLNEGTPVVLSPRSVEMERSDNLLTSTSEVKWDGAEVPSGVNWGESTIRLATVAGEVIGALTPNRSWGSALAQESAGYLGIPVTALIASPGSLTLEFFA